MPSRKELTIRANSVAFEYAKEMGLHSDLCGVCAISSFALMTAMETNDEFYRSRFIPFVQYGYTEWGCVHAWVISDGYIYDPTYNQFDIRVPYYIGPPTRTHKAYSRDVHIVSLIEEFRLWDEIQQPTEENLEWFLERMKNEVFS